MHPFSLLSWLRFRNPKPKNMFILHFVVENLPPHLIHHLFSSFWMLLPPINSNTYVLVCTYNLVRSKKEKEHQMCVCLCVWLENQVARQNRELTMQRATTVTADGQKCYWVGGGSMMTWKRHKQLQTSSNYYVISKFTLMHKSVYKGQ